MTNIGETLRAAREEQAFSLDDVVAATRIRMHFLEALEENNFDALGGNVYVRGFLRNYATFLGLDPEPLVAPFRSKEHKLPVYKPSAQPRYLAEPLQSNPLPLGRILFMLFFLILLGVIGFSLWVRPASLDSIMAYLPIQSGNTTPIATAIQPAVIEPTETAEPLAAEETTQPTEVVEESSEPAEEEEEAPESAQAPAEEEATATSEPSPTVAAEASPTEEVATAVPTATRPPRTPTAVVSDTVATPVTLVSDTVAAPTEAVSETEAAPTEAVAAPTEAVAAPTATEVPPTEVVPTPTIVVSETPTLVPTESIPTPTPEPTATEVNQEVVIQAQILGDTWLRVFTDNNNANAIQETVTAGDRFEWIGLESVNIRAGNGAAISITVNGQEYGVLGGSGQVVDLRWERDPEGDVPILVQQ